MYLVFPSRRPVLPQRAWHPWAVVRLLGHVATEMVISNVVLARQILTPRTRLEARIIEIDLAARSESILTLIANITALTPGTMTVDARLDPPLLTIHALVAADADEVIRETWRLEELCVQAFGTDDDRARLAEVERT
jgi:multisubunit Na+/H+ antiporter MnhE subunit